ncbi:hydrogenase nickel incorporation protein HypB [Paludibaculum fermentans]|uniref:Hydrogenase nickel incorporation protein HypB n=1 Tax=Paludibaculum fermentans TaxID=1473598 RepID=A0A7S7SMF0_PALFE|nr:hydrogenase nickel incorporation protein HypB [Paludibaculum fermentans]QOY89843.1 hydrogenase nickel incorporation protein HypB [Paludibaculum fermentans]
MNPVRIPVVEKVLSANDSVAAATRAQLDALGIFSLNLMASPGAGKTSLVERTAAALKGSHPVGMVNGDTSEAAFDAERSQRAGALSVHINTGGKCHLEAAMVRDALALLPLDQIRLLIIENVGNLVCPSAWQLGAQRSVLIASIPEGDDKPYKYPKMYSGVDVLVINKIDLLPYVDFRMDYFRRGVETLNPGLVTFAVSCRTGEGLDAWFDWLRSRMA